MSHETQPAEDGTDGDDQAVAELLDQDKFEDPGAPVHHPGVVLVEPHPDFGLDAGFDELAGAEQSHRGLEPPEADSVVPDESLAAEEAAIHIVGEP